MTSTSAPGRAAALLSLLALACGGEHPTRVGTSSEAPAAPAPSESGAVASPAPDANAFPEVAFEALARFPGGPPEEPEPVAGAVIGPEGGTLALGAFEIVVPAGAVERPTPFQIRRPRDAARRARVVVELRPHGVAFAVPVAVRFPLAGTEAEGSPGMGVVRWAGSGWTDYDARPIEGGTRAEARVAHFSVWGLAPRAMRAELSSGGE